jgi:hypothetical protein
MKFQKLAITINRINVTVLGNGSVLVPSNGTWVRIDSNLTTPVKRRPEDLDFLGLVKRWWLSMKNKLTRHEISVKKITESRNSLDVLGAIEALNSKGWFTPYDV